MYDFEEQPYNSNVRVTFVIDLDIEYVYAPRYNGVVNEHRYFTPKKFKFRPRRKHRG